MSHSKYFKKFNTFQLFPQAWLTHHLFHFLGYKTSFSCSVVLFYPSHILIELCCPQPQLSVWRLSVNQCRMQMSKSEKLLSVHSPANTKLRSCMHVLQSMNARMHCDKLNECPHQLLGSCVTRKKNNGEQSARGRHCYRWQSQKWCPTLDWLRTAVVVVAATFIPAWYSDGADGPEPSANTVCNGFLSTLLILSTS